MYMLHMSLSMYIYGVHWARGVGWARGRVVTPTGAGRNPHKRRHAHLPQQVSCPPTPSQLLPGNVPQNAVSKGFRRGSWLPGIIFVSIVLGSISGPTWGRGFLFAI